MNEKDEREPLLTELLHRVKAGVDALTDTNDGDVIASLTLALEALREHLQSVAAQREREGDRPFLAHADFQRALRACHFVVCKAVPHTDFARRASAYRALLLAALDVLSCVSILNPDDIIPCWPLFLADTFSEEKSLVSFYADVTKRFLDGEREVCAALSEGVKLSCPLLLLALDADKENRFHGLKSLAALLGSRDLSKWLRRSKRSRATGGMSEKIERHLCKALRVLSVVFIQEDIAENSSLVLNAFEKIFFLIGPEEIASCEALRAHLDTFVRIVAQSSTFLTLEQLQARKDKGNKSSKPVACLEWLSASTKTHFFAEYMSEALVHSPPEFLSFSAFSSPMPAVREYSSQRKLSFPLWLLSAFTVAARHRLPAATPLSSLTGALLADSVSADTNAQRAVLALASSDVPAERLLCSKVWLRVSEGGNGLEKETAMKQLNFLRDPMHLVRIAALETIGTLNVALWNSFGCEREMIAETVCELAADETGTVRAAAFRAMGEMIRKFAWDVGVVPFRRIIESCKDSKLAVRVQAMWALSKVLLLQWLPRRLGSSIDSEETEDWLNIVDIALGALNDSEKIRTTALRCLSYSIMGLFPELCSVDHQRRPKCVQLIQHVVQILMSKYLSSSMQDQVQHAILSMPQKILVSLIDIFGFVLFASMRCEMQVNELEILSLLFQIFLHGELQGRLEASQTLLALMQDKAFLIYTDVTAHERFCRALFSVLDHESKFLLRNVINKVTSSSADMIICGRRKELRRNLLRLLYLMPPNDLELLPKSDRVKALISLMERVISENGKEPMNSEKCLLLKVVGTTALPSAETTENLRSMVAGCATKIREMLSLFSQSRLGPIDEFRLLNLSQMLDDGELHLREQYHPFAGSTEVAVQIVAHTKSPMSSTPVDEDEI